MREVTFIDLTMEIVFSLSNILQLNSVIDKQMIKQHLHFFFFFNLCVCSGVLSVLEYLYLIRNENKERI